jgi:hypothetical protein
MTPALGALLQRRPGLMAGILVLLLGALVQSTVGINRDVAYYVLHAGLIATGHHVIGNDAPLFITNLIASNYAFNALPWLLTQAGLSDRAAVFGQMALLFIPTIVMVERYVRPLGRPGLAAAMAAGLAAMLFVFPVDMFGQREHMFVVLILPYLLHALDRLEGGKRGLGRSPVTLVWGALAVLIKPHYLAVVALVEVVLMVRERRLFAPINTVTLVMVVPALAYYALVMGPAFLDPARKVAVALNAFYLPHDLGEMLIRRYSLLWLPLILGYGIARLGKGGWSAADIWLAAWAGTMAAAISQMKGVDYHWFPATALGLLGLIHATGATTGRRRLALAACLAVFVALAGLRTASKLDEQQGQQRRIEALSILVEKYAQGGSFVLLGTDHWPQYPLATRTGLTYASRFNSFWFFDSLAALEAKTGQRHSDLRARLVAEVVKDFETYRPRLVLLRPNEEPELAKVIAEPPLSRILAGYHEAERSSDYIFMVRD